jgi:Protein of unknown function (DUF4089)
MTSTAPDDILAIAEHLGFPIPEPYRAGVTEAFARLLDQAALVMAAEVKGTSESATDFVP